CRYLSFGSYVHLVNGNEQAVSQGTQAVDGGGREVGCGAARVDDEDDDIGVVDRLVDDLDEGVVQQIGGVDDSGCIDEDHLGVVAGVDADHSFAGGLREGGDDAQFGAQQSIEQGGLTGIGKAYQSTGAGAGRGVAHGGNLG